MFINTAPAHSGSRLLAELGTFYALELRGDRKRIAIGPTVVFNDNDLTALNARYDDIVSALESGDVVIYDCTKKVGYWKAKKATGRAPASKEGES